ncbi:MAG: glycosyltransferase family 39 protein [Alphaproteobacteria bacterium]|nr:glycosyltransferase family 39 protein [Alphaproteobacteria bacterium]
MRAVAILIVATALLRAALGAAIGLGIDESYMVAAGRTLQWGYFDHPPLAWWLSSGIAHLLGNESAWVVRLPFVAIFALTTWLMARLTADLYGERAGLWAAISFNLAPVFGLTTGGWVLPDGPLDCALLAAGLCLYRGLEGRGTGWWLGAGFAAGLALLSKYSAGLVMLGALVAMLSVPEWRRWFARWEPYAAGLLALAVFAPVPLWNAAHGWASFAFQGGRAAASRWNPGGPFAVLAGAAGFILPWIWLGLLAGFWRGFADGPARRASWLLAWLAVLPIVLFTLIAVWSRNVLFHWAMPGYLFLFPLLGARLAGWQPERARRWAVATAGLLAVLVAVAVSEVRFNWLSAFRPGLDPGLQAMDLTPLRGVLAARGLLGMPIAAASWNDTGKIGYALGGNPPVICLNLDARQFGMLPGPAAHIGADILIVALRQDEARIRGTYAGYFERIDTLEAAAVPLAGRGGITIPLFVGRGLKRWP